MGNINFVVNENSESVNALKTINIFIDMLETDLYNWKWVIISTHNCLQNFMVSSLRNGNNLTVLENKSSKKWYNEFTRRMKITIEHWQSPNEKLEYFLKLYKKIKSSKMLMLTISKKFVATENHNKAMKWLNYFRNEFIHFVPKTFEINVKEFPQNMLNLMDILKFLVSESGNILWLNYKDKSESEKIINEIVDRLKTIKEKYSES